MHGFDQNRPIYQKFSKSRRKNGHKNLWVCSKHNRVPAQLTPQQFVSLSCLILTLRMVSHGWFGIFWQFEIFSALTLSCTITGQLRKCESNVCFWIGELTIPKAKSFVLFFFLQWWFLLMSYGDRLLYNFFVMFEDKVKVTNEEWSN